MVLVAFQSHILVCRSLYMYSLRSLLPHKNALYCTNKLSLRTRPSFTAPGKGRRERLRNEVWPKQRKKINNKLHVLPSKKGITAASTRRTVVTAAIQKIKMSLLLLRSASLSWSRIDDSVSKSCCDSLLVNASCK